MDTVALVLNPRYFPFLDAVLHTILCQMSTMRRKLSRHGRNFFLQSFLIYYSYIGLLDVLWTYFF